MHFRPIGMNGLKMTYKRNQPIKQRLYVSTSWVVRRRSIESANTCYDLTDIDWKFAERGDIVASVERKNLVL